MGRLLYRVLIIERGFVSCGEVTIPGPYNREGVGIVWRGYYTGSL